jgi:cytochrome d ubiquinol oxidase subunit II
VIGGVLALAALALHGTLYLAVKTENELQQRSRMAARFLSIALLVLTVVSLPATIAARPDVLGNYRAYPVLFLVPLVVLLALIAIIYFSRKHDDRKAFASSCLYLAFMLVGAAVALYPRLLPSSDDAGRDITIANALSGPHTLHVGLIWWAFGMCLALMYFVIVYRLFRGKVRLEPGGYAH